MIKYDIFMDKLKNTEFNQSLIRLCIGGLTYFYVSAGIKSGYFLASQEFLNYFALAFFSVTLLNILSIFIVPVSIPRRYMALAFDIASTSFSSYLTGGINSVYILIYLWIYIGYGTRYGLRFLITAVIFTLIGYNLLLVTENAWHLLTLEAIAFILLIIALPIYLYSLQKRLILSAQKAQLASDSKTEFLSNMTHQIRTPIGGIVGMIDLLNKTDLNTQQKQYLQALSQSSHSLQEIIEDIVDFSRIEGGQIPLDHSSSNPRALIDSLVHSLAPLGYDKQLELTCFIDKSFPTDVSIDAQRFRQLLSNLIRYVIEHSTSQGINILAFAGPTQSNQNIKASIEIHFRQNTNITHLQSNQIPDSNDALPLRIAYQLTRLMNGLFEIKYTDNQELSFNLHFNWHQASPPVDITAGFPEGKRVLIFDPDETDSKVLEKYCQQLGMEVYSTSGGDNFIAHIIWSQEKQHPFDVIILSEDRKHRICHELLLRIRNEARCTTPVLSATYLHSIEHVETDNFQDVQATIIKPISLDILKSTLIGLFGKTSLSTESDTVKQTNLNILLAEDNEINASIVYSYLTDLGHNVDIATDGTTALYAMHKHHYQMVLMDLNMPNMGGIEATRQWRRLEKKHHRHLPIIALTAKATSEDRDRCARAGMDDFITKPVNEQRLRDIIQRYTS